MTPPNVPRYSKPALLVFDMGGVLCLVDEVNPAERVAKLTGRSIDEAFAAVFAPQSKRPMELGHQTWVEFVARASAALGGTLSEVELRAIYSTVLAPHRPIFPLLRELMRKLPVGLCSNTSQLHWEIAKQQLPFWKHFQPLVLSYEVGLMKPDKRIYERLTSESGVAPGKIFFVDDNQANVAGALEAGLQALVFKGVKELTLELRARGVLDQ